MKYFTIAAILFFFFSDIKAGSFSELFGSEGAAGVSNSKSRSLSYSMQYIAFSGVTGYVFKQLYETGFLEPVGLVPEYYKKLSPLVYDKKKNIPKTDFYLRKSKDKINLINDIETAKNSLKSKTYLKNLKNQRNFEFNNVLLNERRISNLIERYNK